MHIKLCILPLTFKILYMLGMSLLGWENHVVRVEHGDMLIKIDTHTKTYKWAYDKKKT